MSDREPRPRLARGTSKQETPLRPKPPSPRVQLEAITDPALVIGLGGEIVDVNGLAETLLGLDRSELGQMLADDIVCCPTADGSAREYATQIHVELITAADGAHVFHKTRRKIPVDVMLSPDLANAVVFVTLRETSPTDLRHMRDEDVAMIGHDLRSPLSVISLEVAMLDDKLAIEPTSEAAASLRRIGRNLDYVNNLLGDLLDLSAIERARFQIERRPIELAPLVASVIDRIIATPLRPRVRVHATGTAVVVGDERRLERVLANLLHNALRYTPNDSAISVWLGVFGDCARVSVRDAGPGLTPDEARHIFEKHRRAGSSRGRSGFGLGLFVSRKIIDAHGGRIGVESTFGSGSCFFFDLPLADVHADHKST